MGIVLYFFINKKIVAFKKINKSFVISLILSPYFPFLYNSIIGFKKKLLVVSLKVNHLPNLILGHSINLYIIEENNIVKIIRHKKPMDQLTAFKL